MAPAKKKGALPPTSEQPVRRPGSKKADALTRAEKKAANKAAHAATGQAARDIVDQVVEKGKAIGAAVVARPYYPAQERYWRRPEVQWSAELEEDLFTLMSTGHGMNDISKLEGMPTVYQMMKWLSDKTHPFSSCRARAQSELVPYYEELAKDIAMTSNAYSIVTKKQVLTKDGDVVDVEEERVVDNVERSKLAVSTLQWVLGHLAPKKHGRTPDTGGDGKNEQLEGLFAALKAGPVKT